MQALDTCRSVSWNIGYTTTHQWRTAWARYTRNERQRYRSVVPMRRLAATLVQHAQLLPPTLRQVVATQLHEQLMATAARVRRLMTKGTQLEHHLLLPAQPSMYCARCEAELFDFFVRVRSPTVADQELPWCLKCRDNVLRHAAEGNPLPRHLQYSPHGPPPRWTTHVMHFFTPEELQWLLGLCASWAGPEASSGAVVERGWL